MVGMSHEFFSLPGLIALYGIFWEQHEILKICKQDVTPNPKEDLDSDSVHFSLLSGSLYRKNSTSEFSKQKNEICKKETLFSKKQQSFVQT